MTPMNDWNFQSGRRISPPSEAESGRTRDSQARDPGLRETLAQGLAGRERPWKHCEFQ